MKGQKTTPLFISQEQKEKQPKSGLFEEPEKGQNKKSYTAVNLLPSVICNYRAPLITGDLQHQLKQSITKHYFEVPEYKCINSQNSKSLRMLQLTASKKISSSRNLAKV